MRCWGAGGVPDFAALFCGVHAPNWFLMLVAFPRVTALRASIGGTGIFTFWDWAHATVGFLLYLVAPDSVSHHLKVGPGWFGH